MILYCDVALYRIPIHLVLFEELHGHSSHSLLRVSALGLS